ncbi:MAG TPA: glycosyltransferase family 2 protein [Candidatus Competibacteraceae bacterium]|nr:MAG: glycosyltransferase family 2 protein [Candidatus Competibacteraceae bacterium]HOB62844.1 glycosyltransferase family 2 protein [Candidatus Competibacteraceae bacterium]HQA26296.1 glycosyltransferase family 2 protein [Candidatus Competibacteraceae bacterium]HQD57135.1 glycosyltransferase family 2 protein [Candidatus Competibacteraceae bacterium]
MTVAVVIPAYDEAATIATIVQRARLQLETVIVVDDGSIDDTASQAAHAGAMVLRQPSNQGKGAALWHGLQQALALGAEAIITLDGDGQHRPEDLPKLLDAHRRWPDRLIIAARLERRDRAPRLRRFANGMADFWLSWAAGWPIRDSQSGFRLYPATLLRQMSGPQPGRGGFAFESQALLQAARLGGSPVTVAIETLYPPHARPSHYRAWRDTLRIIALVAGELFGRGLYPVGLLRALRQPPLSATSPDTKRRHR